MIKMFEEFTNSPEYFEKSFDKSSKFSNEDLVEMLSVLALIYHHGQFGKFYGQYENMIGLLYKEPFNFLTTEDEFGWSDDYNWSLLTDDNREQIFQIYKSVYKQFELGKFPLMDELDEIMLPLKELTEVDLLLNLENKEIIFTIDVLPFIKGFPDRDNIKVDLQPGDSIKIWDSIISEILPAYNRITDLGYECELYMKSHGKYELRVTT